MTTSSELIEEILDSVSQQRSVRERFILEELLHSLVRLARIEAIDALRKDVARSTGTTGSRS